MKKLKIAVLAFFLILAIGYSTAWFFIAQRIAATIAQLPAQAAANHFVVEGSFSRVRGFPLKPYVTFSGRLVGAPTTLVIPALTLRAIPFPGFAFALTLPLGLSVMTGVNGRSVDSGLWSAQSLDIEGLIPRRLPGTMSAERLADWRDQGGAFTVTHLDLKKEALDVTGTGSLTLDKGLQPTADLAVTVTGYDEFIKTLRRDGYLKKKQASIARAALGLFAHPDASGRSAIATTISLQNGGVYLGPALILTLPPVRWKGQ